jgi:hypothetical protein
MRPLGVSRRAVLSTVGFVVLLGFLTLDLEFYTSAPVSCGAISLGGGPVCSTGSILPPWSYPALLAALVLPLLALVARQLWWLAPVGFALHGTMAVVAVWVHPGGGSMAFATLPAIFDVELAALAAFLLTIRGIRTLHDPGDPQIGRATPDPGGLQSIGLWLFGPPLGRPSPRARWVIGLLVLGGCAGGVAAIQGEFSLYAICPEYCVPPDPGLAGSLPAALLIGTALLSIPAFVDRSLGVLVPWAAAANVAAGTLYAALGTGPYLLGPVELFALLVWDLLLALVFVGVGGVPTRGPGYRSSRAGSGPTPPG